MKYLGNSLLDDEFLCYDFVTVPLAYVVIVTVPMTAITTSVYLTFIFSIRSICVR